MKKLSRFLLGLLIFIVAAVLILGLIEPNDTVVTRSTLMKAPKDAIYAQIINFKNWTNWSPWYKIEPTVKMTYIGTDGQPGAGYEWVGEKTGAGTMKITSLDNYKADIDLDFTKPIKSSSKTYFKLDDTAGMVKVTWVLTSHAPYPMNSMNLFMSMDKMLGPDFEHGLADMKAYVESHATAATPGAVDGVSIQEVDFPAHIYEGMRQTMGWDGMMKFFSDSKDMISKAAGGKINGPYSGLFYTWDTLQHNSDMAAVFAVADTTMPLKGGVFIHVDGSKAYMAVQHGGYSTSMQVHNAIGKYLATNGKTRTLTVEEYIAGPLNEPDSNKWVTNIYYLFK